MSKTKNSPLFTLIKGVVISYCITMVVFIIFALLLTYTDFPENIVPTAALITTAVSCIICGFVAAAKAKSRGLLWGIAAGGCYMLIMFTIGFSTIPAYELNQKMIISLCLALGGGAVGGVFGVNKA